VKRSFSTLKFIRIKNDNLEPLRIFLNTAGKSLESFRYFKSRGLLSIRNHLATVLLERNGEYLAYGHLDKEDDDIWLGICVSEHKLGMGYGKQMMEYLISIAEDEGLERLVLSVDSINGPAINLYRKFGFVLSINNESTLLYELLL